MPPLRGSRAHVVLVPGFAGFDALGQIEYYAGVTPAFQQWKRRTAHDAAVLHYFDNLPTASVATRADRLRSYLSKCIARGEVQDGDTLALVGHSTGGLDVRKLVADLLKEEAAHAAPREVDGAHGHAASVGAARILDMQPRLVFLSVPQLGTNIANWVRDHNIMRAAAIGLLRGAVAANWTHAAADLDAWVARHAATGTGSGLLSAVEDAVREMDDRAVPAGVARQTWAAEAHEAEAEVRLWLRHIGSDFAAIDDLAFVPSSVRDGASPAHATEPERAAERAAWGGRIRTRSYATMAPRPFAFGAGPVPKLELHDPRSPRPSGLAGTDAVHRLCYRACAGGPFAFSPRPIPQPELFAGTGPAWEISDFDNDGIVNTASMLWPDGAGTRLVIADHGDIIGHYQLQGAGPHTARANHTYDLLGSASGFDGVAFKKVWEDVFDFAFGRD